MITAFLLQVHSAIVSQFSPKIIGGRDAERDEYPFMVSIRRTEMELVTLQKYHVCGGAIINTKAVVSAAHCLYDPFGNLLTEPNSYLIVAGILNIWTDISTEKYFVASEIYRHPDYNPENIINDISVLIVSTEFDFSGPSIQPIGLYRNFNIAEGVSCEVLGMVTQIVIGCSYNL